MVGDLVLDDVLLEAVRVSKRKHSPEAFVECLREFGYVMVKVQRPTAVFPADGSRRWDSLTDSVFANLDGTVDIGAYDDLSLDDAREFTEAMLSAVTHLEERNG